VDVICSAAIKKVFGGMSIPYCSFNAFCTSFELASLASVRAFALPGFPAQAPQSRLEAYGLLALWLACPTKTTKGANVCHPQESKKLFTKTAFSSTEIS